MSSSSHYLQIHTLLYCECLLLFCLCRQKIKLSSQVVRIGERFGDNLENTAIFSAWLQWFLCLAVALRQLSCELQES